MFPSDCCNGGKSSKFSLKKHILYTGKRLHQRVASLQGQGLVVQDQGQDRRVQRVQGLAHHRGQGK